VSETKVVPRLFDDRLSREWIGYTILRHIVISAAIVHFSLAALSGYRAVVQVYRATLTTDGLTLHAGSHILADVVTAGRTYVDVKVSLEQNGKRAVLASMTVPENESFFYDFRSRRAHLDVIVTRDMLRGFTPGSARASVVAVGRAQWLRVPPPKTDHATVSLR